MGFLDICYFIVLSCIPWASLFFWSGPKGSITWFSLTNYWLPGLADVISCPIISLPPPVLGLHQLFKDKCVDKQAWAFLALVLCQVRQVCHRARHDGMMGQGKQELGGRKRVFSEGLQSKALGRLGGLLPSKRTDQKRNDQTESWQRPWAGEREQWSVNCRSSASVSAPQGVRYKGRCDCGHEKSLGFTWFWKFVQPDERAQRKQELTCSPPSSSLPSPLGCGFRRKHDLWMWQSMEPNLTGCLVPRRGFTLLVVSMDRVACWRPLAKSRRPHPGS